jgi:hypothetical protein
MEKKKLAEAIIAELGGTKKTAVLCDANESAVSMWKQRGIPRMHLKWLRIKRPSVFKKLGIE